MLVAPPDDQQDQLRNPFDCNRVADIVTEVDVAWNQLPVVAVAHKNHSAAVASIAVHNSGTANSID